MEVVIFLGMHPLLASGVYIFGVVGIIVVGCTLLCWVLGEPISPIAVWRGILSVTEESFKRSDPVSIRDQGYLIGAVILILAGALYIYTLS